MSKEITEGEHIKRLILKGALIILAERGFKALKVDNVVRESKISKTTFYKHFRSKKELVEAIRAEKNLGMDIVSQRDEILNKASHAFFRLGVDEIDMDSIAKASGISRPSLYRYFSSKEELLEYAVQYELKSRHALLKLIEEETQDPIMQFELLVKISCEPTHEYYGTLMLVTSRYKLYKNEKIKECFYKLVDDTIEIIEGIFEKGKKQGKFRDEVDSHTMAVMFLALYNGIEFNHEHDKLNNPNDLKWAAYDLVNTFLVKKDKHCNGG